MGQVQRGKKPRESAEGKECPESTSSSSAVAQLESEKGWESGVGDMGVVGEKLGAPRAMPAIISLAVAQLGAWVVGGAFKNIYARKLRPTAPGFNPLFPAVVADTSSPSGDFRSGNRKVAEVFRPKFPEGRGTSVGNWKLAEVSEPSFCDFGELGLETWACFQFWNFRPETWS